ncbi:glycosyltransferase involved in cell wall biosynthesis [Filimonas zeae]|uniref:Glycosyl transferase n=1 Tax=Filimonas zeae TaxID=1737353 RepID=A0A917J3F0_9BACT|nr:glycosyltransferase [Filimonas zeae]MDR6341782.1 glycosyltransferase involved in cell wall biosynthesis [Filimonas zeae]GGH80351.1 glycosyl transferase [Filimonas zeae]
MKVAIVHDELVRKGGAEQVVLSMHKAFPDAPIYTLCYNSERTYPEFKGANIITSWFQKIGKNDKLVKLLFFPFALLAMRSIRLRGYDVVLLSTTHCAKFIRVDKGTTVISYCHTPLRVAWRPWSYENLMNKNWLFRRLFLAGAALLRHLDKFASKRTDFYIANSIGMKAALEEAYHPRNAVTIINPSVKLQNFYVADAVKDYYLVVSRLEPYKKVDLVIDVFNAMPDKKLVIVGKGSQEAELKKRAKDNIVFLNGLDAKQLAQTYAEAKALIFPQQEDYGITPLESAASGRPVIAFGKGGILDTMIPYTYNSAKSTALFFKEQSVQALDGAVKAFEQLHFDPQFIRQYVQHFSENRFIRKIQKFVEEVLPGYYPLKEKFSTHTSHSPYDAIKARS